MSAEGLWTPSEGLMDDVRHALAHAPRDTPEERFEAWAWRALLDEVGPALLTRAAVPSHITASAVLLSPEGDATCLVLHARMGCWVQPGGHLESGDPTLAAAAAREAEEETGLTGQIVAEPIALSRHRAPCRPDAVDWHLDVQHMIVADPTPARSSQESDAAAWFDLTDLPEPLAPGVAAVLDRALARMGALAG